MGEDTIDKAAVIGGLEDQISKTKDLRIHGWLKHTDREDYLHFYGSDAIGIKKMIERHPELGEMLHDRLRIAKAQVVWAVKYEMARTVEDFLARRTRALLLDARASAEMAPEVARLMADKLRKDEAWQHEQVAQYRQLVEGYILN